MNQAEIGGFYENYPRKIAMLLSSEATGGEERYFVELAIAMGRTAAKPIIVNLKAHLPYKTELESHLISTHANVAPGRFDPFGVCRLLGIIRSISPDVLIINGNRQALWLGSILGRWCRVPVILIHTHAHMGLYSFTLRIAAMISDAVVAAANNHRSYLHSVYKLRYERIFTVYPGIDQRRTGTPFSDNVPCLSETRPCTVGIIAALRPEKDHETFLRAAVLVKEAVPNVQFLVIGDGPRRSFLENLAREIGLGTSVNFLGWQKVDGCLLRKLDVLTLSSLSETFPAVMIEAFSAGVPVVVTNVGSVAELLGSPPCGLLVPPRDPQTLSDALLMVVKDQQLYSIFSQRALKRAEFFSGERFCAEILQLAHDLLQKKLGNRRPK